MAAGGGEGLIVLVTGATGFVGANLVRGALAQGAEVHAIVRPSARPWRLEALLPRIHVHPADIADARAVGVALTKARPHVVYHSAMAGGHPRNAAEREEMMRVSLLGTSRVLEASWDAGVARFVQIGSWLEYSPRASPLREDVPMGPVSFRGVAKAAATLLCRQFSRERSWPLVVLRLFSVFGPWESSTRFVPSAIRAALGGGELPLTPPGIRRDFVFVDDVVEACLRAAVADVAPGEVINVGSGEEHANEEVVALVERASGRAVSVRRGEHPMGAHDGVHCAADIQRAREVLGWAPRHSLAEGIARFVEWVRRHEHDGRAEAERPA
jgi:nucleoside-diphosphate-sugar epimerase